MALNYTYIKYKDVHTLQNNEGIDMNYEIIKISCNATTVLSTGTMVPGQTITLNFATDGNYTISLSTVNDEDSFSIKYFQNLLKSFITDAERILCGCAKCDDCAECNECQDYLGAFMKSFAFNSVNVPLYQAYVDLIAQSVLCDFTDEVICSLIHEKVFGSSSVKEPMLKILSYYYAAFYYKDYYMAVDAEEENYITTKYKFNKIAKCIKKLGVDPAEIIEIFENGSMVYYWQLNNTQEDITDVIPLLSPNYISAKPSLLLETFEQGYIVNYSQVGRICFAIMPTQIQNFTIEDSLNNDITNDFDVHYEVGMSLALFVSKLVYSYSNIYFKFKKGI
jgi:hypothetical protein